MKAPFVDVSATELTRRREVVKASLAGLWAGALTGCSRRENTPVPRASKNAIKWKGQTFHPATSPSFEPFTRFCAYVAELSDGQLTIEARATGDVVPTLQMFEAASTGKLDLIDTSPVYAADIIPGTAFLSSYPLGLDRPDQWETWYYDLGGLDLARRMHAPHGIYFLAPIQHDLNIIHSRVPIRSFEDFRGKKLRMPGGLIAEVFDAAGAKTIFTAGDQVYPALQSGAIEAADFSGPATNFTYGFANVAKYVILGPRTTPCIHQPVDLHAVLVNVRQWDALPKHLQDVLEYAVRRYSWDHYAFIQKANTLVWEKYKEKGVTILRLSEVDVAKFRRLAVPLWFKWAKKDALAHEAFASQLEYLKNPSVAYLTDDMLVDAKGNKLTL